MILVWLCRFKWDLSYAECMLRRSLRVISPPPLWFNIQYRGEPPGLRGGVLGLRPPGCGLRIICLDDSVILFILLFSAGSTGPV